MSWLQRIGVLRHGWLVLLWYTCDALGAALQNITLPLPVGTTNNGTPGLLCTPTRWTDVASFYLLNYVAHAATVITRPGERSVDFAVTVLGSLLFPALGLYRGVEAILCGALFGRRDEPDADLRKAAKSGALCMVVRSPEWRPKDGEIIPHAIIKRGARMADPDLHCHSAKEDSLHLITYQAPWTFSRFGRPTYVHRQTIHGAYALPPGYRFVLLSPDTYFASISTTQTIEVAATYNLVKALVALAQTGYASLTLYRSRGDQIEKFGFTAFGLTVAPYAVMSIMNLLGNLCRPDYASLYMVESSIMDEARARGGTFYGTVGRVEEERTSYVSSYCEGTEPIQELKCSVSENGNTMAGLSTYTPVMALGRSDQKDEKSVSEGSSAALQTDWHIKDLPQDGNYTGTEGDPILFIPSANTLKTLDTSLEGNVVRRTIASITLKRTNWLWTWKCKPRTWSLTFSPTNSHPFRWRFTKFFLTTIIALLPLLINGLMSHFKPGTIPPSESDTWRSYVLQWLIVGVISGIWFVLEQEAKDAAPNPKHYFGPAARVLAYVLSASPAIGGFIVVGQMLSRYGTCTWIGS
ncbi:hypothetical protein BDV96DRAFT_599709 [Lophiotrema nucula]|uniref:Uncharacterized protein n=1 Tax=Lophiotrema nucula TaxID=690887 RepID=A0A6A5Z7H2_9PLEO|nr:hypothetical protein BDV96DRAFT_599709 [Lophiotrema nucula]